MQSVGLRFGRGDRAAPWALAVVAVALIAVAVMLVRAFAGSGGTAGSVLVVSPPVRVAVVYSKFVSDREPGEIDRVAVSGRHVVRLGSGEDPVISPDGRWVVYRAGTHSQPSALLLVSANGGAARRLPASSHGPVVWSLDSRYVAAGQSSRVVIVNVRSRRVRSLSLPEPAIGFSFSPDDRALAFSHATRSGQDVYTVSTTTGAVTRLTTDRRSAYPLWGGDGIAFERFGIDGHDDRCVNCHGDVWLMNPSGGHPHQLTHTHAGMYPAAWSADGSRLLAAYPATFNGRLYAVDLATGRARALTPFVGDLHAQGLSRNGHTVLAAVGCGQPFPPDGVVETIPFTGGSPTVIARGPCRASWNA